jgi:hypothetical protein
MVFVSPTPLTRVLVPALVTSGFIFSLITLVWFPLFFAESQIRVPWLTQVDSGNAYFSLFKLYYPFPSTENSSFDKLLWNTLLVIIFWVQHSTMARSSVKDWLNSVTGNQWFFLEKSMYSFTSSVFLFIFLIAFEPVVNIKLIEPVEKL